MVNMKNMYIIIPALSPDIKMLSFIKDIRETIDTNILIVNDGSKNEYDHFFNDAVNLYGCELIRHNINLGKGRALKNAFNYVLNLDKDIMGAITADCDGQHKVSDIIACAQALTLHPESLIMGCRKFKAKDVPFRSKWGNNITKGILHILCGVKISDSQTGLRGLSCATMRAFLATPGERFEYETNMLLDAKEKGTPLFEVPIQTVYIEENKSTHFNPVRDSVRIYSIFFKYIFSSLSSSLLDIIIFKIMTIIFINIFPVVYIFVATGIARAISSLFNYFINQSSVFKSRGENKLAIVKYYILCVIIIVISAFSVNGIVFYTGLDATIAKVIVDSLLFLVSFQLQREWVFKKK
ncbi:MAG: bifunctional glycosyltransferase family 2/GtrA family protein [Oscillospiraceae bacterium]